MIFSLSPGCNLFVLFFHALELDYDDDGNESDYDDDAKMASVTRGYHEHRKGILLKVPINPTPGLPTDLHHSHTISISANLNSLLSHHLTKN